MDPSIYAACRTCENWNERDVVYVVGVTKVNTLQSIWMVYGDCYAANSEVYKNVLTKIKAGVLQIPNIEFDETKELGKLKRVDPLGITLLRMRGLWHITNPAKVFRPVLENVRESSVHKHQMVAIMRADKYASFPVVDRLLIENTPSVVVSTVRIQNPDNPANLLDAVAIIYRG